MPADAGRIDATPPARGKKPDSECPISIAPFSCTASAAMFVHVGLGCRQQRVEIGNHLLVELVDRFDRELAVGKRRAERRAEAKHGPRDLMGRVDDVRQRARRRACRLSPR